MAIPFTKVAKYETPLPKFPRFINTVEEWKLYSGDTSNEAMSNAQRIKYNLNLEIAFNKCMENYKFGETYEIPVFFTGGYDSDNLRIDKKRLIDIISNNQFGGWADEWDYKKYFSKLGINV